uniref:tachykinin-3b n=1 Tax=Semicossyphus pulcher TaxID=241346 RepID=UPI0037E829F8
MERTPNCSTLASLVALVVLILLPVRSLCKEETYKSLTGGKPECCVSDDAELKRFDDTDYDSFVSLFGRRSAAQPNSHRNTPMTRKGHVDHILADLLGQKKRLASQCAKEYLQTRGRFINHERKRFQHIL